MLTIELEHYWSALSRGLSGRLNHLTPAWSLSIHSQTSAHYHSLSNIEMLLELWKLSEVMPALPPNTSLDSRHTAATAPMHSHLFLTCTMIHQSFFHFCDTSLILKNWEWAGFITIFLGVYFKSWNATRIIENNKYLDIQTFLKPSCWIALTCQDWSLCFFLFRKKEISVYKYCQCKTNLFIFKAHVKFMLMLKT